MKKTLIALLALAGMVSAATVSAVNGVYSFGASDWTATTTGDTYSTLTFDTTINLEKNDWILSFTADVNPSKPTNPWGTALITSGNAPYPSGTHDGGFQFYITKAGDVNIKGANLGNSNGTSMDVTLTAAPETATSYTFTISKVGTTTTYEVSGGDLENTHVRTIEGYDWADKTLNTLCTSVGGVYGTTNNDQLNNKWSLPAGSFRVIPEPATATLSLLALASLCARRRRG